ncbi:MAG: hypothetical protein U5J97_10985 [Trueperaceae bacterium]|nr:hypothetical protein [Trueperaceae bacterium]
MIRHKRAFIEAAVAATKNAKELVLPMLMVEAPEAPWTPERLRDLRARRDELDAFLLDAVDILADFELPFLEEEERLAQDGRTLASGMAEFEVAMVDFERAFWDARFAEHQADPDRWSLTPPAVYDVCDDHRLTSADVRRVIADHGATSFADLAPYLGTSPTCSTCHTAVSRLLVRELRRAKDGAAGQAERSAEPTEA